MDGKKMAQKPGGRAKRPSFRHGLGEWVIIASLLGVIFLAQACNADKKAEAPAEERIDRDSLVDLLADLHLADAVIVIQEGNTGIARPTDSTYYEAILKKHQVQREDFESTIRYYTQHAEEFEKIYQKVILRLKAREDLALREARGRSAGDSSATGLPKKISNPTEKITGTLPDSVMREAGANSRKGMEKLREKINQTRNKKYKHPKYNPDLE